MFLRNFEKFTEKNLCQSLLFNKVAGLRPATLFKKRPWHRCFPVNFAKFLITPVLQNTSRRLLLVVVAFNPEILQMSMEILPLRGCLHVKFHPGMKLVPEWNHPCLWWNVSYCFHVFAEMKFHPGMKDRDEISSWDEKKKKRLVNTSSRDEILKWACFFNFWRMYPSMFSKFNMFEHNESMNIVKRRPLYRKQSPKRKRMRTASKKSKM